MASLRCSTVDLPLNVFFAREAYSKPDYGHLPCTLADTTCGPMTSAKTCPCRTEVGLPLTIMMLGFYVALCPASLSVDK